jgi:hypothetical protein
VTPKTPSVPTRSLPHTRLALRVLAAAVACWFAGGWLAGTGGSTGVVRAQTAGGPHSENLRSADQVTSMTALLRQAEASAPRDGSVNFDLLKETVLKRKPPPIYPESLAALDGRTVTVRGFMAPYDSLTDMRNMMLMQTSVGCYFCVPPSPKEVVFVRRNDAKEQPFIPEPIEATGTLKLWSKDSTDPEHTMFLYVLDDAKIRPIPPPKG